MKIPRWLAFTAIAWTLLFWFLCIGIPICTMLFGLLQSLHEAKGGLSLWDPLILHVVRATVIQALCSAGIATFFGTVLGLWILPKTAARSGTWSQALLAIPYGIP